MTDKFKPIIWFYLLCFLLLGFIPLFDLLISDGSMNFDEVAARASAETGLVWTSNLLVVMRMAFVEPSLLMLVFGSAVPAFAALVTLTFIKRPEKWKSFLARLHPARQTTFNRALGIYGTIFIVLVPLSLVVLVIRQATGGNYSITPSAFHLAIIPALLTAAFLDQGAVLEELGWRGFATPELQDSSLSALKVAVIVGIGWGLWHLPRDITTGVIERLGLLDYLLLYLPAFVSGTIAVSVIASYFMNRLGGSVIPAIVIHGITNDSIGLSGTASIIEALTPYHQATRSVPMALVAVVLVIYAGPSLGLSRTSSQN
jgi:hypothetical protein